jgi:SAM-dependent methyltransferase
MTHAVDSPEATSLHRERILAKESLSKIYSDVYRFFKLEIAAIPGDAPVLELGSGPGIGKDYISDLITSDVIPLPHSTLVARAESLPCKSNSLRAIISYNVLHHLPDIEAFLSEASRVLIPGGKLLFVEPTYTWWSGIIYRYLHHEPFDTQQIEWKLPEGGRLSVANDALPWIVFVRDRERFTELFPDLILRSCTPYSPFSYLLTGGVSYPYQAPSFVRSLAALVESNPWIERTMGMFMKGVVEKKR